MDLPEIIKTWGAGRFAITGIAVLGSVYGMYNNKSIILNDDKSLQSILPLWILAIIMITFLLHVALKSYDKKNQWGASLSSLSLMALCIWVPISLK